MPKKLIAEFGEIINFQQGNNDFFDYNVSKCQKEGGGEGLANWCLSFDFSPIFWDYFHPPPGVLKNLKAPDFKLDSN